MSRYHGLRASLLLPLLMAALMGGPALAQDTAVVPSEGDGELKDIDEILVYSRKRAESIQDVPVAVTAFDQALIESVAPSTLRDFDGLAPNVFIGQQNSGAGQAAIYIRGQGYSDVDRTQAPPVGVLIDNVFLGTSTGQILDTFDIEQVEINRGPQTVLFGKNTTGGTISVRRKRPNLEEYGGRLKGSFGNFDGPGDGDIWTIQGVGNIPIIKDQLALRVGYIRKDGNGFSQNSLTGADSGDVDYEAINAKLLWEPTENLSVLANWDWMQDRGGLKNQDALFNGDDPHMGRSDRMPEEGIAFDAQIFSLEITWETDFGTFESVTSYMDSSDKALQDFDGGVCGVTNVTCALPFNLAPFPGPIDPNTPFAQLHTTRSQAFDQFSQELRWTHTYLDERLSVTAGVFLWHHDASIRQETNQVIQIPNPLPMPLPCAVIGGNNGAVVGGRAMCLLASPPVTQRTREKDDSWSVFGSATFAITEDWNASAGVRYIYEEKDFETSFRLTNTPGAAGVLVPIGGGDKLRADDDWNDVVFQASTDYRINENVMVYFSYGQGFRSGGFSNRGVDPTYLTYEPETLEQYEVGIRSEWFDSSLIVNLSAFKSTTEDPQTISIIQTPGVGPGTNTFQLNGEEVQVEGVELETSWAFNEMIRFYGSAGYQTGDIADSTQRAEQLPLGLNGTAGPTCQVDPANCMVNVGGGQLVRSPKFSFTVGTTYTLEIGPGTLIADVRWKHQDDIIFIPSAFGTPFGIDSYNLVDSTIAYEWSSDRVDYRVALVGKNLGNTEYIEQALPSVGFQTWAPPRYIGLEIGGTF